MSHKTHISIYLDSISTLIGDDQLLEAIKQLRLLAQFNRLKEDKEMLILMMESNSLEYAFIHERIEWTTYSRAKRKLAFRVLHLLDLIGKYHSLEYPESQEKKIKKISHRA